MGLALDLYSDPIPGLTEQRHLGPEPDRRSRLPRSTNYLFNGGHLTTSGHQTTVSLTRQLPDYKLPLLELARREDPQYRVDRRRQLHRNRTGWGAEAEEGVDLAQSDVPLPSDRDNSTFTFRRTPSLERQEAFRDETTSKRNRNRLRQQEASFRSANGGEDGALEASTQELYRLGLLYDDEHVRGEAFTFDALVHDEPAYSLRPAKRARRFNRGRGYDAFEPAEEQHLPLADLVGYHPGLALALDLSFAELARDDAIARFLISPDPSETSSDDEDEAEAEPIRHSALDFEDLEEDSYNITGNEPLKALSERAGSVRSLDIHADHFDADEADELDDSHDVTKDYNHEFPCSSLESNGSAQLVSGCDDTEEEEFGSNGNAQPIDEVTAQESGEDPDAWVLLDDDS